jgi:hypothetical protein
MLLYYSGELVYTAKYSRELVYTAIIQWAVSVYCYSIVER